MPTPPAFGFSTVPHLHCAAGAASAIGQQIAERHPQARRALIVTDGDLQAAGLSDAPRCGLEQAGLAVSIYSGVIAAPPEAVLRHAVDFARDHRPDVVVGIGGGSALDAAKLVALLAANGTTLGQVLDGAVHGARLPLVLMPTNASGAQSTGQAYLTNANGNQLLVDGTYLIPDMVILDAGMTVGLPPLATAASGMMAVGHAIAACTSAQHNPLSGLLGREALTLLSRHLLPCCDGGANLHARQAVLLGAHLAGQAIENARAPLLRALAAPLGALFHVPYAESVALMLPHLLRAECERQREQLADLAAIVAPHVIGTTEARAEALVVATQQLAKTMGLASSLESVGVMRSDLDRLLEEAMLQWSLVRAGPCPLTREQMRAVYAAAL